MGGGRGEGGVWVRRKTTVHSPTVHSLSPSSHFLPHLLSLFPPPTLYLRSAQTQ